MKLQYFRFAAIILLGAIIAGCISPQQFVRVASAPVMTSGYIGGEFVSLSDGHIAALILVKEGSNEEIIFPFANQKPAKNGHTEVGLLALEPGVYKFRAWMFYNTFFMEKEVRQEIKDGPFSTTVNVKAGGVVFIGKLDAQRKWTSGAYFSRTSANIQFERMTLMDAKNSLKKQYPEFVSLPFLCLTCFQ